MDKHIVPTFTKIVTDGKYCGDCHSGQLHSKYFCWVSFKPEQTERVVPLESERDPADRRKIKYLRSKECLEAVNG